jgi:hypothetical protein
MATITKDLRRMDDKRTLWSPYWLISSPINYNDFTDANVALLWSFPAAKYGTRKIIVENIAIQVITAFAGGTPSINIGYGTIATDIITTGGTLTEVDADEYIPTADITEATAATYWAVSGDWITAYKLKTNVAPVVISPADATVPCIYAIGFASGTAGVARVLLNIQEVPTF